MSNDTFIREVNEEIRQERVRAIWKRYGIIIIALVSLIVLGTIGYVVWERIAAGRSAADGDRLIAAQELVSDGDFAGAETARAALADDGTAHYPVIARMHLAGVQLQAGDPTAAVAAYDTVASDASAPRPLRDIASIRAAYILVDHGTAEDVRQRAEALTGEGEPLRHPALEAIGLALWKAGDYAGAAPLFGQLVDDFSTPAGMAERARMMQELIAGETGPAPTQEAPEAPDAAGEPDPS